MLEKKTTILFPPGLHRHLRSVARRRRVSLGALVRQACEAQYGPISSQDRRLAVEELRALALPVGSVREMKRESVPEPADLLP